jgi:hypothetical protein
MPRLGPAGQRSFLGPEDRSAARDRHDRNGALYSAAGRFRAGRDLSWEQSFNDNFSSNDGARRCAATFRAAEPAASAGDLSRRFSCAVDARQSGRANVKWGDRFAIWYRDDRRSAGAEHDCPAGCAAIRLFQQRRRSIYAGAYCAAELSRQHGSAGESLRRSDSGSSRDSELCDAAMGQSGAECAKYAKRVWRYDACSACAGCVRPGRRARAFNKFAVGTGAPQQRADSGRSAEYLAVEHGSIE